jgi:hypothetical protein
LQTPCLKNMKKIDNFDIYNPFMKKALQPDSEVLYSENFYNQILQRFSCTYQKGNFYQF